MHHHNVRNLDTSLIFLCMLSYRSKTVMAMSTAYHGDANEIIA